MEKNEVINIPGIFIDKRLDDNDPQTGYLKMYLPNIKDGKGLVYFGTLDYGGKNYYFNSEMKYMKEVLEKVFLLKDVKLNNEIIEKEFRAEKFYSKDIDVINEKLAEKDIFKYLKELTGIDFRFDEDNSIKFKLIDRSLEDSLENIENNKNLYENIFDGIDKLPSSKEVKNRKEEIVEYAEKNYSNVYRKKDRIERDMRKLKAEIEKKLLSLKVNKKFIQDYKHEINGKINHILKKNLFFDSWPETSAVFDQSAFLSTLKYLNEDIKKLKKLLVKTKIRGKFITKDVKMFYDKLKKIDFLKIYSPSNKFFGTNCEDFLFKIEIDNEFKKLYDSTMEDIAKNQIILIKYQIEINEIKKDIDRQLECLTSNKGFIISKIKKVLDNKTVLSKYPLLRDLKKWIKTRAKEYKNIFNFRLSNRLVSKMNQ